MNKADRARKRDMKKHIAVLREQNTRLHTICQRQRDTIEAHQETIVQLNAAVDRILVCLVEKYGSQEEQDGKTVRRLSFPLDAYPGALERCRPTASKSGDSYVIVVTERTEDGHVEADL